MGKKGKALRSQIKSQAKRSKKQANRAMYQARAAAGENTKSFRNRKKSKKGNNAGKGKHLIADCGNVGCLKCNPVDRPTVRILNRRKSLELISRMFTMPKAKPEVRGGNKGYKYRKHRAA